MDYIYIEGLLPDTTVFTVTGEPARHVKALRLRNGESVGVLNGKGLVANCTVNHDRTTIQLIINEGLTVPAPPTTILAMGLLDHKDRFEFALEKVIELGVTHFIPLLSQYVQHRRAATDRWRTKVISAITQSGNPWLPVLSEPQTIGDAMLLTRSCDVVAIADADGSELQRISSSTSVAVYVGPEGGFSIGEVQALHDHPNVQLMRLSSLRLRAETAAIAAAALIASSRY